MKKFSTYLLVMFMVMFWLFRVIIAFMNEFGTEFMGVTVLNMKLEVTLLFTTLIAILLIMKRRIPGGLIYLLTYGLYFGTDLFQILSPVVIDEEVLAMSDYMNVFASFIGFVLPIVVMIDLLLDRNHKKNPVDKKTDWFYKNDKFDRELDERADKNNYRTL